MKQPEEIWSSGGSASSSNGSPRVKKGSGKGSPGRKGKGDRRLPPLAGSSSPGRQATNGSGSRRKPLLPPVEAPSALRGLYRSMNSIRTADSKEQRNKEIRRVMFNPQTSVVFVSLLQHEIERRGVLNSGTGAATGEEVALDPAALSALGVNDSHDPDLASTWVTAEDLHEMEGPAREELRTMDNDAEDKDAFAGLESVAVLVHALGQHRNAASMHKDIYEKRVVALGVKHEDTLRSAHYLSVVLLEQKKYAEADKYAQLALDGRIASPQLGPDHMSTIQSKAVMARIKCALQEFQESESLSLEVVSAYRTTLGEAHPDSISAMQNLGNVYRTTNRTKEAIRWYKKAYIASVQGKLEDDVEAAHAAMTLAMSLYKLKVQTETEELVTAARSIFEKKLGKSDPLSLQASHWLGLILLSLEKAAKSVQAFRIARDGRRAVFGDDHNFTLQSTEGLARALSECGELVEALELMRLVWQTRRKCNGANNPKTLCSAYHYGALLNENGQFKEAVYPLREAYGKKGKDDNEVDHKDVLNAGHQYAYALANLRKIEEARDVCEDVVHRSRKVLPAESPVLAKRETLLRKIVAKTGGSERSTDEYQKGSRTNVTDAAPPRVLVIHHDNIEEDYFVEERKKKCTIM